MIHLFIHLFMLQVFTLSHFLFISSFLIYRIYITLFFLPFYSLQLTFFIISISLFFFIFLLFLKSSQLLADSAHILLCFLNIFSFSSHSHFSFVINIIVFFSSFPHFPLTTKMVKWMATQSYIFVQ